MIVYKISGTDANIVLTRDDLLRRELTNDGNWICWIISPIDDTPESHTFLKLSCQHKLLEIMSVEEYRTWLRSESMTESQFNRFNNFLEIGIVYCQNQLTI